MVKLTDFGIGQVISTLPLHDLLKEYTRLSLASEDGDLLVEPDGESGPRFVRLAALAAIDTAEKAQARAKLAGLVQ